jgi:hypothetical protein
MQELKLCGSLTSDSLSIDDMLMWVCEACLSVMECDLVQEDLEDILPCQNMYAENVAQTSSVKFVRQDC